LKELNTTWLLKPFVMKLNKDCSCDALVLSSEWSDLLNPEAIVLST